MGRDQRVNAEPVLLERLHRRTERKPVLALSRRAFLAGLSASGPSAAASFSLGPERDPIVSRQGSRLVLSYRGREWVLDRSAFGPAARISASRRRDRILIQLARATFPGTSLRADLVCRLDRTKHGWSATLSMPALRAGGTCALAAWMDGAPLRSRGPDLQFAAGEGQARVERGSRALSSRDGLTVAFEGKTRLSGAAECTARGLEVAAVVPGAQPFGDQAPTAWATRFDLRSPAIRRRAFACGTKASLATVTPLTVAAADGHFFSDRDGTRRQLLLIDGQARVELRTDRCRTTGFRLSRAVVALSKGKIGIAGELGVDPQLVTAMNATALVAQVPGAPFQAQFRAGEPPRFAAALSASRLWLAEGGAGQVTLSLAGQSFSLVAGPGDVPAFKRSYPDSGTAGAAAIVLDQDAPGIDLSLASPIRVRRVDNLLDCTIWFASGFTLRHEPMPLKYKLVRSRQGAWLDEGFIVVQLGPQHRSETVVNWDQAAGNCPAPTPTKSDYSGTSLLVFTLPRERDTGGAQWRERELDADSLTDWSGLRMVVDRRASSTIRDDDLKSQLDAVGIALGDDAHSDKRNLKTILEAIAAQFAPPVPPAPNPAGAVTRLELVDGILFSCAEATGLERAALPPAGYDGGDSFVQQVALFSQRMGRGDDRILAERQAQDARLRALWSEKLQPHKLPVDKPTDGSSKDAYPLVADDHWQIIGQTSVYGLPALRRLSPEEAAAAGAPRPSTVETSARKVPRGGVVRPIVRPGGPNHTLAYLEEIDRDYFKGAPETGIALATAFQTADVSLTALGATMRLDWRGEPAILEPEKVAPYGFSLERFYYETVLGRDVRVIAATKGYLLPFGNRASLFHVSERIFLAGPGKLPVAQEIKRQFIVTPAIPKGYPAVNQPDGGRDFPASSVTILTDHTPDLVDPETEAGGRIFPDQQPLAFWPKVRNKANEIVDFEWKSSVDEDKTPLSNRMIFIAADAAAKYPAFVRDVVAVYNADEARRVATLGGARRNYVRREQSLVPVRGSAADLPETAFDTDSWILQARGRASDEAEAAFVMDARMNGADQPPFYPRVETARIAVQSLDRLIGEPQGLVDVAFYRPFVTDAFTDTKAAKNAQAQIFLEILGPQIRLRRGKQPSTGGIAEPGAIAAALSAKIGLVGSSPSKTQALALTQGPWPFPGAAQGQFNPREFFQLNLFGVDLTALIEPGAIGAAPKLTESVDLGVHSAAALDAATTAARLAADALDRLQPQIEAGIAAANDAMKPLKVEDAYPDLIALYRSDYPAILGGLRDVQNAGSLPELIEPAQRTARIAGPLLREIGRVLRDPVPPAVSLLLGDILAQWAVVEKQIRALPDALGRALADRVRQELYALADTLAPLFGLPDGATLIAVLSSPEARARLANALFYDELARPLLDLLDSLFGFADAVQGRLAIALGILREQARSAVAAAVEENAAALIEDSGAAHDVLRPEDADALAAALASAVADAVAGLVPTTVTPAQALEKYKDALATGRLANTVELRVRSELAARSGWFHITGADPAALFRELAHRIAVAVRQQLVAAATRRIDEVEAAVIAVAEGKLTFLLSWAGDEIGQIMTAAEELLRASDVAEQGQALANWCKDQLAGPRAFAAAVGDRLLGPSATIAGSLTALKAAAAKIDALTVPPTAPASVVREFNAARAALGHAIAALEQTTTRLDLARTAVQAAATADICANFRATGDALARAIDAAADAASEAGAIARATARLLAVANSAPLAAAAEVGSFPDDLRDSLGNAADATGALLRDVTTAGKAGLAGDWTGARAAAQRVSANVGNPKYRQLLLDALNGVETAAGKIRAALPALHDHPEKLIDLLDEVARLLGVQRQFDSLVLQTAALGANGIRKLRDTAAAIVKQVAAAVSPVHGAALGALEAIDTLGLGNPVLAYFLANFSDFDKKVKEARADQQTLDTITASSDPAAVLSAGRLLVASWNGAQPPLLAAGTTLALALDQLLQGKFAALVAELVREKLKEAKDWLDRFIAELVPTSVSTNYEWDGAITGAGIFRMAKPDDWGAVSPPALGPEFANDLTIRTRIEFDFLTKKSTVVTRGYLKPFKIGLISADNASFFGILFNKAEFESINGATPHFRADLAKVEIGPSLKLLQALQQLMAPGENGIYVEPRFDGIKVGYRLSVPQKEVGSLQLINLAFDVFADLPYNGGKATFGFLFASALRPFLISNPPYGGGGWVSILIHADDKDLTLSLMFGAVTAIHFGPLAGQGRIVAGILFSNDVLVAFVEAVGEGNIACFSIAIYIRISLTHNNKTGGMFGEASYEFRFKVGFFSVSYKVKARYAINDKGGSRSQAPRAIGAAAAATLSDLLAAEVTHKTEVPCKSLHWNDYRNLVSTELV